MIFKNNNAYETKYVSLYYMNMIHDVYIAIVLSESVPRYAGPITQAGASFPEERPRGRWQWTQFNVTKYITVNSTATTNLGPLIHYTNLHNIT